VSPAGGRQPLWERSGRELLYISPDQQALMSVSVRAGSSFSTGTAAKVLDMRRYINSAAGRSYDVSPDGRSFLLIKDAAASTVSDQPPPTITVVLNWSGELKQRVATR